MSETGIDRSDPIREVTSNAHLHVLLIGVSSYLYKSISSSIFTESNVLSNTSHIPRSFYKHYFFSVSLLTFCSSFKAFSTCSTARSISMAIAFVSNASAMRDPLSLLRYMMSSASSLDEFVEVAEEFVSLPLSLMSFSVPVDGALGSCLVVEAKPFLYI